MHCHLNLISTAFYRLNLKQGIVQIYEVHYLAFANFENLRKETVTMENLLVLTEVVTETPEVAEEAFNLVEWLNSNTGLVTAICTGALILTSVIIALYRRAKRRK